MSTTSTRDPFRLQFEQRMKARRAATCVTVARAAIADGRLVEAQERLDEAAELDPENAEVRLLLEELASVESLTEQEGQLPSTPAESGWAHYLAVVVAIVALAALAFLWPNRAVKTPEPARQEPTAPERPGLASTTPPSSVSPLASAPQSAEQPVSPREEPPLAERLSARGPEPGVSAEPSSPRGLAGPASSREVQGLTGRSSSRPAVPVPAPSLPSAPAASLSSTTAATSGTMPAVARDVVKEPVVSGQPSLPVEPASNVPAVRVPPETVGALPGAPERSETVVPTLTPAAEPAAPAAPRGPDPSLDVEAVQQTLKRYADAYGRLDARAARSVWPTVDQVALERAFAGLVSQGLVFDRCEVRVAGDEAAAHCNGSARYVPKVGSREPRIENRRWTFQLRRAGSSWQIHSADSSR